jgi:hypothetical protein
MLRRLMLFAILALASVFLVLPEPVQAQSDDVCWTVFDSGTFNEASGAFIYVSLFTLHADPGDLIMIEIVSDVEINEVDSGWANMFGQGEDEHCICFVSDAPTVYQHIFDLSNPEVGVPLTSSGTLAVDFFAGTYSGLPFTGSFTIFVSGDCTSGISGFCDLYRW